MVRGAVLLPALQLQLCSLRWLGATALAAAAPQLQPPQDHQGGRYGTWRRDALGMPFYSYEMDQLADRPQAQGAWPGPPQPARTDARATVAMGALARRTVSE